MLAILTPTIDNPEFIRNQLQYYLRVGFKHTVYIGDSSNDENASSILHAIDEVKGRVNVIYERCPGANETVAMFELAKKVQEPYVAFCGDDDFFLPAGLDKSISYISEHPDYSLVHGKMYLCSLADGGQDGSIGLYRKGAEFTDAKADSRLKAYFTQYFDTVFSVQPADQFREAVAIAAKIPDRNFRTILYGGLSAIRGKSKELDCTYLYRQLHGNRFNPLDQFDWLASPAWSSSYPIYANNLTRALVEETDKDEERARALVKEVIWGYTSRKLSHQYDHRYSTNRRAPSGLGRLVKTAIMDRAGGEWLYSLIKRFAHQQPDSYSLKELLNGATSDLEGFEPALEAMRDNLRAEFKSQRVFPS
jgi:glycosyltransferase domain-containing protein